MAEADDLSAKLAQELSSGVLDTERAPSIANVPTPTDNVYSLLKAVNAMRQIIELREARAGSVMDKHLSLRDLVDAGVLSLDIGNSTLAGNIAGTVVSGYGGATVTIGGGSSVTGYVDPRPTYLTPPTITGLKVAGAFTSIILTWDIASINYLNFAYVEVWRNTSDNLGAATLIGTSTSSLYVDEGGTVGATYYYWLRARNSENTAGAYTATTSTTHGGLLQIGNVNLGPLVVQASNIASGAITPANFQSGTAPVFFGAALPSLPNATYPAGTTFILTTTYKLYRSTGAAWTSAADGADIAANSITAGQVAAGGLAANTIVAGSAAIANGAIGTAMIGNAVVDEAKIANLAVSSAKIADLAVTGAKIADATIGLAKINTATIGRLSALSAFLGDVTVDSSGSLKGGQTAYATGTGFFLGWSGTAYKFSIGSGASMLTWDGSTLTVPAATVTGQLTTSQIANSAITNAKIGNLEVDSAKIANLTIGTGKVASGAITQMVTGTTSVVSPSDTSGTSKYTESYLGTVNTSADGDGRVVVFLCGRPPNSQATYTGYGWMNGAAGNNNIYCRVVRTINGGSGTVISSQSFYFSGFNTRDLLDSTTMVVDSPGAGVAAAYYYTVYSTSDNTATHRAYIPPITFGILEARK